MHSKTFKLMTLLPVLGSAGLLAFAYYQEYVNYLDPCPLCMLQRVIVAALGLLFLLALLLPSWKPFWRRLTGFGLVVFSLFGIGVAARHVWLQSLPPDQVPDCGPGLGFMFDNYPFKEFITSVLSGSGECAEVSWRLLGLSMPAWMIVVFAIYLLYSLWWITRRVEPLPPRRESHAARIQRS